MSQLKTSCSFCGVSATEVPYMVATEDAAICSTCIDICVTEIVLPRASSKGAVSPRHLTVDIRTPGGLFHVADDMLLRKLTGERELSHRALHTVTVAGWTTVGEVRNASFAELLAATVKAGAKNSRGWPKIAKELLTKTK